jgi:hypothetical protein
MSFRKNIDSTKRKSRRIESVFSIAATIVLFSAPYLFYNLGLITTHLDDYLTAGLPAVAGILIICVDIGLRYLIRYAPKSRLSFAFSPVVIGGYALILAGLILQGTIYWGDLGNMCCKPLPNNATCGRFMHCDEKGRHGECGMICYTCDAEGNRLFPPK